MADNKHNEQRVSITGAIFSRNNSIPALGEAYSDPSNLLWGDVVKLQGAPNKLLQSEAIKYCELGGGRLPTREDFVKLATYLGYGTSAGYSPFSSDGKTEIIPGLSNLWFLTSSESVLGYVPAFNGPEGKIGYTINGGYVAFRCVVDP